MATPDAPTAQTRTSRSDRVRAVVTRLAKRVVSGPVLDFAAQLAFYAVLALAPFLVVLTSLAGFLPSATAVEHLLTRARGFMPPDAFKLVSQVVHDVVDSRSATLLTVGLVTALWSASRVADALRTALNSAHGLEEGRSFLRRQAIAIGFTVGGAVLLLASVVASVVGAGLVERLAGAVGIDAGTEATVWGLIRWPMAVGSLGALAAFAYRVLPDTRPRAGATGLGALVATALFLASSRLFSFYAENFADFGLTYGALTGGVVLLLWSWLSAISFIVGGEVTAALPGSRPRRPTGPTRASR
jgi:membrane protein